MKTSFPIRAALCLLALQMVAVTARGAATDISTLPMSSQAQSATPNMILGIDDSGSMDFEVLLPSTDGALWWDTTNKRFWSATGVFNANIGSGSSSSWIKYTYLFPNGSASDARQLTDGTNDHFAIPPIPAYAALRSSAYNPIYYNSTVTYTPWVPAYISSATRTFAASSTTAARSHPWFPTTGSATTMDLTTTLTNATANWTFRMFPGMTIPGTNTIAGITRKKSGAGSFSAGTTTDYLIVSGDSYYDVAVPYYPATFYVVDATCTATGLTCATAPDGKKLRRYEIKAATASYPSGRTYTAEMQNFANWYAYYRKRDLMLSSAAGQVFPQIKGLRGGTVFFNNNQRVTMYDLGATSDSANVRTMLGNFYSNPSTGGTPMRVTLDYIGQEFTRAGVIQYACQRNNAFIVTDGYANTGSTTPLSYSQSTWITARPFTTTTAGTLADIAAAYYTRNPRPDLTTGMLSIDPTDPSPAADKNPNLHVNTYALTLGALGTIYGTGTQTATNPYLNYPTWPTQSNNYDPSAVDDLWHATINGRGSMFTVRDSTTLVATLRQIVSSMLLRSGSDSSVAVSNVNVRNGDNTVYVSSYNGQFWSGELAAYPIDLTTGQVLMSTATQIWEARDQLTARTPASRNIVTYDGTVGVPFQVARLSSTYLTKLNTPNVTPVDNAAVVAYLRGDRTGESTTYRQRSSLLGDIVSAQPTVVNGAISTYDDTGYAAFAESIVSRKRAVYAASNDGTLHVFDAGGGSNNGNGAELWAYIPGLLAGSLNALTSTAYSHQFMVDGTPVVGDVYTNSTWRTMLVGGFNAGGSGYYALDITNPTPAIVNPEVDIASKVMWEFPNSATGATDRNNMGLSFGKPVIAKVASGSKWVVLVTSGYNNTAGDGKGHLYVLDAGTGALIKDLVTTAGTGGAGGTPSNLGQISAFAATPQTDATIDYVYGGDLMGNVWRFDLTGASSAWNVKKIATLVDPSGVAQPVSTAPELVVAQYKRMLIVGTGLLVGQSDVATTQVQSIYALVDDLTSAPTIATPRTALYHKTVTVGTGGVRNIPSTRVDLATWKGWYFDLPGSGERLSDNLSAVFGAVVFATNQPSPTACNAKSYIYVVDVTHGGQLASAGFLPGETPWTGKELGSTFSEQPVIALLPNGTLEALTHGSDNSLSVTRLPISFSTKLKRITWKEVLR